MRDPAGNTTSYAEFFEHYDRHMGWREEKFATITLERQIWYSYEQMGLSQKMVLHRYGRGDRLDEIQSTARSHTSLLIDDAEFLRTNAEEGMNQVYPIDGTWRGNISFAGLALLLVEAPEYPELLHKIIDIDLQRRAYLTDILFKAFIPNYSLARKYRIDKYSAVWMDPIQRALALPAGERA